MGPGPNNSDASSDSALHAEHSDFILESIGEGCNQTADRMDGWMEVGGARGNVNDECPR